MHAYSRVRIFHPVNLQQLAATFSRWIDVRNTYRYVGLANIPDRVFKGSDGNHD